MRVTEQNVVQQIKYKNEDSISYVLQSYGGLLNTIIRKYLQGNQQDIEECLADVLVSIWFHINSFDSTKNEFKQWIAAIAKYRAIDYVRRSEKSKQYISKFELEEASSQSISKQSEFDITYLFNKLNSTERSIFEKYYVEGVSSKEIANEFQAKESWVHNKLSRGRKKLKTILQKGEV
ncbi:RNA polymerase sigma-70 factor, ECF subfamily [Paenisporosarcina quisquiliarum]|uniref:Sigma-70 family RNA polymerase sigma factor n=1 Tax=Psychrobacillus psychrodurans TaxID=126157 RepID=A0A9X3LAX0_9BACI|nr:sigma-70 family RNA polymerase sigma factor [Psychrobacillus psychrodurans]MCZ8534668.1 sigma-70 family RNA polymerase sigma factor [Psychrobacillus psychrodurans]SEN78860.1 RNA polymerase sigma-70 factor, ECF subfamily [Paenisporosarcina quisquiliarum]